MLEDYNSRTQKSAKLWKKAVTLFPGGVSHNIRNFGMPSCGSYPPYISHGKGGHIWDEDGNEYIDWWMTLRSASSYRPRTTAAIPGPPSPDAGCQGGKHLGPILVA